MLQLGLCCVYIVFTSQNMQQFFDRYYGEINYSVYMIIIFIPMIILANIQNFKYLTPVSWLANILQFIGLGIIFFYILQDIPSPVERKLFATCDRLPLYFGTVMTAFTGSLFVLPLEKQMKTPADMKSWVLNISMVSVSFLYIAVGFIGYLKYGDTVAGSLTLNLPVDEIPAQIVKLLMSLAIFFSYSLQFYIPVDLLEKKIQKSISHQNHSKAEYALRCSLVILTFALASAISKLDLFISLVGAVSISTLALMMPAVLDLVMQGENCSRPRALKNVIILTFGFCGFVTGSFVSIRNIIQYFSDQDQS